MFAGDSRFLVRAARIVASARTYRPKATMVLAEANDAARAFGADWLRRHGFRVIEAASGAEALDALHDRRRRIDLLISETEFDDLPFFEALSERAPSIERAPSLFVSAYPRDVYDAALAGLPDWIHVAGYLQKPFTLERLTAEVEAALARK